MKRFLKNYSHYIWSEEVSSFWVLLVIEIAASIALLIFPKSTILLLGIVLVFCLSLLLLLKSAVSEALFKERSMKQDKGFSSLIESLEDAVVIYDQNFKILAINRATETMFDVKKNEIEESYISPASIKNKRLFLLTQVLFPSLAPGAKQLSEVNAWPNIVNLSFENPRMEMTTTLNRILDDRGGVTAFIKVIKDKTHEASVLSSKNEFIDVVAHQLRTPLTAIHWAMENIVKSSENNPEILEIAKEGLKVSERSLKITNDLLDASKIEDGRFGYTFKETDLGQLIGSVIKEMSPIAKEYGVEIISPSPINNLLATLDENSIGMVLFNLIDNAIRYNTKNGRVFVSTEKTDNNVRISIKDTGVGIPEKDLPYVFEKLHRGSNVVQIEPNGTGLGLYIARNIIKRHGGEMGVDSIINRGTTFWFTIPTNQTKA